LALTGRRVACPGGEIDRGVGNRPALILVGLFALAGGSQRLGLGLGRGLRLGVEELLALGDDVRNQVGAGNLGPDSGRELLLFVVLVFGRRLFSGGLLSGRPPPPRLLRRPPPPPPPPPP